MGKQSNPFARRFQQEIAGIGPGIFVAGVPDPGGGADLQGTGVWDPGYNNPTFRFQVSGLRFLQSPYSHSIVAGGLELTSSTTRDTPRTSLVIRVEILRRSGWGRLVQSAVMASLLSTILMPMTSA